MLLHYHMKTPSCCMELKKEGVCSYLYILMCNFIGICICICCTYIGIFFIICRSYETGNKPIMCNRGIIIDHSITMLRKQCMAGEVPYFVACNNCKSKKTNTITITIRRRSGIPISTNMLYIIVSLPKTGFCELKNGELLLS